MSGTGICGRTPGAGASWLVALARREIPESVRTGRQRQTVADEVLRVQHTAREQLDGALEGTRVRGGRVGKPDVFGSSGGVGAPHQLPHHPAHRASAVHRSPVLRGTAAQSVVGTHRAGQGLDQGGVVGGHMLGKQYAVGGRYRRVLRGAARRRDADRAPALTLPTPSAPPAGTALTAGQHRVDGDPVAQGELGDLTADRHHLSGELVPRHKGMVRFEVSPQQQPVRGAQTTGRHRDHDLMGSGSGVLDTDHVHGPPPGDECCQQASGTSRISNDRTPSACVCLGFISLRS